jgi:hypothetical protein
LPPHPPAGGRGRSIRSPPRAAGRPRPCAVGGGRRRLAASEVAMKSRRAVDVSPAAAAEDAVAARAGDGQVALARRDAGRAARVCPSPEMSSSRPRRSSAPSPRSLRAPRAPPTSQSPRGVGAAGRRRGRSPGSTRPACRARRYSSQKRRWSSAPGVPARRRGRNPGATSCRPGSWR